MYASRSRVSRSQMPKRTLGAPATVTNSQVDLDFVASEYGSVTLRAHVVQSRLADVSLQVVYPPGALPEILDTLRSHLGPLTNDPEQQAPLGAPSSSCSKQASSMTSVSSRSRACNDLPTRCNRTGAWWLSQ